MVGLHLDIDLKKALELQQFRLYYQPKFDLASGKITGIEALIRWEHPEKGIISPAEIIPLSEETDLIFSIGEWVIRTACTQCKAWQDAGLPPIIMAINVFECQLYHPNFVENVERILHETGLDPSYLEFEITEDMTMDVPRILPILKKLKRIGARISLDNFGKGNSSVFKFKELPIDVIKIDQSFVKNCMIEQNAKIVRAIIVLAHELNVEVIAEGIETKEHLIFFQQNLCDQGQGYFFCNPVPPIEFEQKLNDIKVIIRQERIPQEVSRQKWLEDALETAHRELRDIVRQHQGILFKFIERNGTFIHTLCDGELLHRMNITSEQIVGIAFNELPPEADAIMKLPYYRKAWEGEDNVTFEGQINGISYLARLRPIRRGEQVIEVIGSCIDITDRVNRERELYESEERYRQLVELAPDAVVVHINGYIVFCNDAAVKMVRATTPADLIGCSVLDFVIPCERESVAERIADRTRGAKNTIIGLMELRCSCLDGTEITVEIKGGKTIYDGKHAIQLLVRDITSRKKVERTIIEEKEKLESLLNNAQDAINIMDLCGNILRVNPAWESMYGWTQEEVVGKKTPTIYKKRFNSIWNDIMERIMCRETIPPYELTLNRKGGEPLNVSTSIHSINNADGEIVAVVASTRDITEIKKAEELIRKSEKLSVVGQLAAGIAHEIRNPLTVIQGFIQLLQKKTDKPSYFDLILSEVSRLNRIVNEFLTLAKPQVAQRKEVNPKILSEQVLTLMSSQALMHNIEIKQEYDGNLPCICCDENQIKQVFINILKNAIESMSSGGTITVQMSLHTSHLIKFRFIDQGSGISEERMKHLGEPFYSSKEKGTGLGLMISNKIVQEHDGTIHIDSVVNQGTTVDVFLPITNRVED